MQISQAKSILLQQESEWSKILGEQEERQGYINYGIILTIISHLASFIGSAFLTTSILGFGMTYWVAIAAIQIALGIAALYFVPQIMAALAPSFGGQKNSLNALKLYVFAMTPVWVGSILTILPVVGWLGALAGAIYGIILFWQHTAEAMSVPEDKKVGYIIVSIICIAVVWGVIGWIANTIAWSAFGPTIRIGNMKLF